MNTTHASVGAGRGERHHRRIAIAGYLSWLLVVLLVPAFFPWLFYRLIACASDVPQQVCKWGFTAPLIPGITIVLCLVFSVWTLMQYDRTYSAAPQRSDWVRPKKVIAYTRGGYRRLPPRHRRHVRGSILTSSLPVGGFLGFFAYALGLPALASIMIGLAPVAGAMLFNRWISAAQAPDRGRTPAVGT